MAVREAVICAPVRAVIGSYGATITSQDAVDRGVVAWRGLLARTGLAPKAVGYVVPGHCHRTSETPAVGRVAARMRAGR